MARVDQRDCLGKKPGRRRKLREQDLVAAKALFTDESITVAEVTVGSIAGDSLSGIAGGQG